VVRPERNWTTTPITADILRGALDLEYTAHGVRPHRLPGWARAQYTDQQLTFADSEPSGVRLVFRTRATAVELDTVRTRRGYVGAPRAPTPRVPPPPGPRWPPPAPAWN
jgi:hypothetical protein